MQRVIVRFVSVACIAFLFGTASLAQSASAAQATPAAATPASKTTAKEADQKPDKKEDKKEDKKAGKAARNNKQGTKPVVDEAKMRAQLESAAREHVQKASRTLRPSIDAKQVSKSAEGFVASYLQVDDANLSFEMNAEGSSASQYVGTVIYVVHEYRCTGASEKEALAAPCSRVKSRRMRELTRYEKGKWIL